MLTIATASVSLLLILQQAAPVTTPDVFGTWQETGSERAVTVSRRGGGVVGLTGAGHQDGSYGLNDPLNSRKLIACSDWTYERLAIVALNTLTLRETGTSRPGCPHGRPTMNIGENATTPLAGVGSGDHGGTVTKAELLLSVADGVLTIETRLVGPDGPVTVSTKKYRRR